MPGLLRKFLLYSGLALSISPSFSQDNLTLQAPTKDEIKAFQVQNDSTDESSLERMIEDGLGLDIRQDAPQDKQALKTFYTIVSEVRKHNESLVDSARGLDIYLMPRWKDPQYVATCTAGREMEFYEDHMTMPGTIVHEFDHALLARGHDEFWDGWSRIVHSYGFEYARNLTSGNSWKKWTYTDYEPQGIFVRPYASKSRHEHSAEIRRYIYENRPFPIHSRKAFDCYHDLLRHMLNFNVLSEKEYAKAIMLLNPTEVINPGADTKEIASRWAVSWEKIAKINGILDVGKLEKPYLAYIPLIETEIVLPSTDCLLHFSKADEPLASIVDQYKKHYPYLTENMVVEYNPRLDLDRLKEFDVVNIPLLKNGLSWYREVSPMASFAKKTRISYGFQS